MISTGKAKPPTSNQLRAGQGAAAKKAAAAGGATGNTPPAIPAVRHGGLSAMQRAQAKSVTAEEILNVTPQFKVYKMEIDIKLLPFTLV